MTETDPLRKVSCFSRYKNEWMDHTTRWMVMGAKEATEEDSSAWVTPWDSLRNN